jgi:hypothetical protein
VLGSLAPPPPLTEPPPAAFYEWALIHRDDVEGRKQYLEIKLERWKTFDELQETQKSNEHDA